jgi:hypothetical protein
MGLLSSRVRTSGRRLWRLAGSSRTTSACRCPACDERIRNTAHAVVVHGERYHVDCALYSRAR